MKTKNILTLILLGAALLPSCMTEDVVPENNVPTLTTSAASDISRLSATLNGTISGKDLSAIKQFGFKFGTDETMSRTISLSGTPGTISYSVEDLTPGASYYFAVYATNGIETLTGSTKVFTTVSTEAATVADLSVTKSGSTFSASAAISDDGGSTISAVGFCYGLKQNPGTQDASCTTVESSLGKDKKSFSAVISDFEPGKTYYIRAYADCDLNGNGSSTYAYSDQTTFTTDATLATVTTDAISTSDISSESVTVNGTVTSDGGADVTERGFVWAKTQGVSLENGNSVKVGQGTGKFYTTITDLEVSTKYYIRAYAKNSVGTAYGDELMFITDAILADVTTAEPAAADITSSTATVKGTVTSDGGADITERGFVWSTKTNPTTVNSDSIQAGTGTGDFSATITGLSIKTTYYVRAYAVNEIGTAYGEQRTFTTNAVLPEVTTDAPTADNISSEYATVSGSVTSDGGADITERGFVWSKSENPTLTSGESVKSGSGTGKFSSTITDLTLKTTYYVRAYAVNEVGIAYGDQQSFTTREGLPEVTIIAVSDITNLSARISASVTDSGTAEVTEKGVVWSANTNPTVANNKKAAAEAGTGAYNVAISENLQAGQTYYAKAYAINKNGIAYSEDELSFTLRTDVATVVTNQASNITSTTADISGKVDNDNGNAVTERGFVYSTSNTNPTLDDVDDVNVFRRSSGSGTGSFSAALTGLQPATKYYFNTYAISEAGTSYGNIVNFTTLAQAPQVSTTVNDSEIAETTAIVGGNIDSDGGATITERGVYWGTSSNPQENGKKTIVNINKDAFNTQLTGLSRFTKYYVVAYAKNEYGTAYGKELSFTTKMERPAVTTSAVADITSSSATLGGEVTSPGGGTALERGVVLSKAEKPTVSDTKISCGSGVGKFSASATGLEANTVYHVRAYVVNEDWTVYGEETTFMTNAKGNTEGWPGNDYNW